MVTSSPPVFEIKPVGSPSRGVNEQLQQVSAIQPSLEENLTALAAVFVLCLLVTAHGDGQEGRVVCSSGTMHCAEPPVLTPGGVPMSPASHPS